MYCATRLAPEDTTLNIDDFILTCATCIWIMLRSNRNLALTALLYFISGFNSISTDSLALVWFLFVHLNPHQQEAEPPLLKKKGRDG